MGQCGIEYDSCIYMSGAFSHYIDSQYNPIHPNTQDRPELVSKSLQAQIEATLT